MGDEAWGTGHQASGTGHLASGVGEPASPGTVRSYRDLRVWAKAMELVVESYRLGRKLPKDEAYGITAQLQRAAVSVPANIAEGNGRNQLGDYLRHLSIAYGSLMELETHVMVARRLGYFSPSDEEGLLGRSREVGKMLRALIARLRVHRAAGSGQRARGSSCDSRRRVEVKGQMPDA
jgi:four helix bundle protein